MPNTGARKITGPYTAMTQPIDVSSTPSWNISSGRTGYTICTPMTTAMLAAKATVRPRWVAPLKPSSPTVAPTDHACFRVCIVGIIRGTTGLSNQALADGTGVALIECGSPW